MIAPRVLGAGIAIVAMYIAILQIRSEMRFANYIELSQRIEKGVQTDVAYWAAFDRQKVDGGILDADCNEIGTRARLTVELAKLDNLTHGKDAAARDEQRAYAFVAARHAIECGPMDGGAWFRMAQLTLNVAGATPNAISAFQIADTLGPAEGWLMRTRAPLYAYLSEHGHPELAGRAAKDIRNYTAYGYDPYRVLSWLAGWPELFHDKLLEGLERLTPRERALYYYLAPGFRLDIGQPKNNTIIKDPFTGKPFNRYVGE
jgi:hypothetical protein